MMYIVLSVLHPLFPLRTCFEIFPDDPFGIVILFYPLSSAKLPIFIYLISLLHTTPCPFFSILFRKFRQFFRFLELMKTDGTNSKPLVVRCVLFAQPLCSSFSGTGPLKTAERTELRTDEGSMWRGC